MTAEERRQRAAEEHAAIHAAFALEWAQKRALYCSIGDVASLRMVCENMFLAGATAQMEIEHANLERKITELERKIAEKRAKKIRKLEE
jgi:hypothetical protein